MRKGCEFEKSFRGGQIRVALKRDEVKLLLDPCEPRRKPSGPISLVRGKQEGQNSQSNF